MEAGARKEAAYLKRFGQPLHPFQRIRELVNYQEQSHSTHLENLERYLRVASDLVPPNADNATRPSIRHPDLQQNIIFVSKSPEITGLIDRQHCTILPLFLQAGITGTLQNYGDEVSESLEEPQLPSDFDEQNETEQLRQVLLLRKRHLHYTYVKETLRLCPAHGEVLTDSLSILRRKLFRHASEPWEGDNVSLIADLVELTRQWSRLVPSSTSTTHSQRPIEFSDKEAVESLNLARAMDAAESQFHDCLELVGVGNEGWVPVEQYADARRRERQLKEDTLMEAESEEERKQICDHWIFDDFDETVYL